MQAFDRVSGIAAPLRRTNVDTDAVIPKQYLKSIERTGFGGYLFDDWRYLDPGDLSVDVASRRENPEFVLNQDRYRKAAVLLAYENFGCGSSREHAVWAMLDYGIRVVIAPSFADIFYNNCFKNGLLPIVLDKETVISLCDQAETAATPAMQVDLSAQTIVSPAGETLSFDIDAFRKETLLKGLDDIGLTLQHADAIRAYEARRRQEAPWLFGGRTGTSA